MGGTDIIYRQYRKGKMVNKTQFSKERLLLIRFLLANLCDEVSPVSVRMCHIRGSVQDYLELKPFLFGFSGGHQWFVNQAGNLELTHNS